MAGPHCQALGAPGPCREMLCMGHRDGGSPRAQQWAGACGGDNGGPQGGLGAVSTSACSA